MNCCGNCFGDQGLQTEIAFLSNSDGQCYYCGTNDTPIIDVQELADKFRTVVNVYDLDASGKPLAEWFREDWALFSHRRMDNANAQVLLADILDDGEIVRKRFVPSKLYESESLGVWEELRQELMHQNRFFPKNVMNFDRLELLLSPLVLDASSMPTAWFRARIQTGDVMFNASEMQAPPPKKASHGRANPAGIPYLYLGSEVSTAVSEIRPHTGELACVARFSTPPDLALVDLRHPRRTVSPFLLADESEIGKMRFDLTFLERLGDELTRPVRPQAAAYDYTPSQYLCEFIKKCGYDGVIYRSSVSSGINLALLYPDKATIGSISQHEVTRVSVTSTPM